MAFLSSAPISDSSGTILWIAKDTDSSSKDLYALKMHGPAAKPRRLLRDIDANECLTGLDPDSARACSPALGPDGTLFIPGNGAIHRIEAPYADFIETETDTIIGCLGETEDIVITIRDQKLQILVDYPVTFNLPPAQEDLVSCGNISSEPSNQIDSRTDNFGRVCVRWISNTEGKLIVVAGQATRQISLQLGEGKLVVVKDRLDFPPTNILDSSTQYLPLQNNGACPLRVDNIHPTNPNGFTVVLPEQLPFEIAPDSVRTIEITFHPDQVKTYTDTLEITAGGETKDIQLTGLGICPIAIEPTEQDFSNGQASSSKFGVADTLIATASLLSRFKKLRLFYRLGGHGNYAGRTDSANYISKTFVNGMAFIPADSVTERGIEYYVHAIDQNDCSSYWPSREPFFYSTQVTLPANTITETVEASKYTMIGLPAEVDLGWENAFTALAENLKAGRVALWRIDPAAARSDSPFVRIAAPDDGTRVRSGGALMAFSTQTIVEGNPAIQTVRTDRPFVLPLQPKWNAFTLPFNFEIPLANVVPDRFHSQIYALGDNKNWQPAAPAVGLSDFHFEPWRGYVVFNDSNSADSMLITPSTAGLSTIFSRNPADVADWILRIKTTDGDAVDEFNTIGVISDAGVHWDKYELREPPHFGSSVSLYFDNRDWPAKEGFYTTDFQPPGEATYNWSFEVRSRQKGSASYLEFAGIEHLESELKIWLFDETLGYHQDMRRNSRYEFISGGPSIQKRFRLRVGRDINPSAPIPKQIELLPNFPNPFNPATTIRFGLPEAATVSIEIYDITGRLVRRLAPGKSYQIGYHNVVWDGRNSAGFAVASGVYLFQLRAKEMTMSRKMTFIR